MKYFLKMFLGTTRSSSSLRTVLTSLIEQLRIGILNIEYTQQTELKYLIEDFIDTLHAVPKRHPILLILDSLDQLDPRDGCHQFNWLPKRFPSGLKIILTTLTKDDFDCLSRCQTIYPHNDAFVEVPALPSDDVDGIVSRRLEAAGRRLTPFQLDLVRTACSHCPLPLFLKLTVDSALRWRSSEPPQRMVMQASVTAAINALFNRVETTHGRPLVAAALGYLTASEGGLTLTEMEDILSLADDVLDDVYQYWTPPRRRLPPLLWVRIRNDLEEYLVERGVDGARVITWYHRQFAEQARKRYAPAALMARLNADMADYFIGTWTDKPKPHGNDGQASLRYVTAQPYAYENGEPNLRKLSQLPRCLTAARDVARLKKHALANHAFLRAKLLATSYSELIHDFKVARETFRKDQDIRVVMETLQLSQDTLVTQPTEIGCQIIGRIYGYQSEIEALRQQLKDALATGAVDAETMKPIEETLDELADYVRQTEECIENLLTEVKTSELQLLIPHRGFLTPPGGQLIHQLSGHDERVNDLALSSDGLSVVTCSDDRTISIWRVQTGELVQSVDVPLPAKFCSFLENDTKLAISMVNNTISIIDVSIGTILREVVLPSSKQRADQALPITICKTKNNNDMVIALSEGTLELIDPHEGLVRKSVADKLEKCYSLEAHNHDKLVTSCGSKLAYAAYRGDEFVVFCLTKVSVVAQIGLFEPLAKPYLMRRLKNRRQDHISALQLIPSSDTQILVCNGATNSMYLMDWQSGDELLEIECRSQDRVQNFSALPLNSSPASSSAQSVYYVNKRLVGVADLEAARTRSVAAHPCRIRRAHAHGDILVTMAADNVLRVWDLRHEPFRHDMTSFTNKVAVTRNSSAYLSRLLAETQGGAMGGANNADALADVVATGSAASYWADELVEEESDVGVTQIRSRFLPFTHPDYVGVVQDVLVKGVAQRSCCVSVWDVRLMRCVRRALIPVAIETESGEAEVSGGRSGSVVLAVVDDDQLYCADGSGVKVVSLKSGRCLDALPDFRVPEHWVPSVVYSPTRKELICESYSGLTLSVYSTVSRRLSFTLIPSHKPLSDYLTSLPPAPSSDQPTFRQLQLASEDRLLGRTVSAVCVWSLEQEILLHSVDIGSDKMRLSHALSLSRDRNYATLCTQKAMQLLCLKTGKLCVCTDANKLDTEPSSDVLICIENVLEPVLQLLHIKKNKKGTIKHKTSIGHTHLQSSKMAVDYVAANQSLTRFITWSGNPVNKTLRYWSCRDGEIRQLAQYSLDHKVIGAFLKNDDSLILDTPSGLIRMRLSNDSSTKPEINTERKASDVLFTDIDVNMVLPLHGCKRLVEEK